MCLDRSGPWSLRRPWGFVHPGGGTKPGEARLLGPLGGGGSSDLASRGVVTPYDVHP
jgi:hypothetical protein